MLTAATKDNNLYTGNSGVEAVEEDRPITSVGVKSG